MACFNKDRRFAHLLDDLHDMQVLNTREAPFTRLDPQTSHEYKLEIGALPIELMHSEVADPERFSILYRIKDADTHNIALLQSALEYNLKVQNLGDLRFGFDPQNHELVLIAKFELARYDAYDILHLIEATQRFADAWRQAQEAEAQPAAPSSAE